LIKHFADRSPKPMQKRRDLRLVVLVASTVTQ
jgi:hypothetical protein